MTLEDFFTLTEMKDGLTAPSRVEELVTVMKKEKDSIVKNVSDATRQWTAVASTIAATENKDCLDLFIQLDGLWFIDRWLKDAQEFCNDSSDSFVEESITALLRALEKLHIDCERSVSSGIWITVKNLLGHNSSRVQDRAKVLVDSWNDGRVCDAESGGALLNNGITDGTSHFGENSRSEGSAVEVPLSKGNAEKENDGADAPKAEDFPSGSLDDNVQPESGKDLRMESSNNELPSPAKSDRANMETNSPNHVPSLISKSIQENSSVEEKLPVLVDENNVVSNAISKKDNIEVPDAKKLNELTSHEKQKLSTIVSSSSTVEHVADSSGAGVVSDLEIVTELNTDNNADANESDCVKSTSLDGDKTPVSELKSMMDDQSTQLSKTSGHDSECPSKRLPVSSSNELIYGKHEDDDTCLKSGMDDRSKEALKISGQESEFSSERLLVSSGNDILYGKHEDHNTSFPRIEDIVTVGKDKEHTKDEGELLRSSKVSKRARGTQSHDMIDKRTSDMELEYGMVDALEVARKVAQEVEREVVDYREPSCSSLERISEGEIRQPGSPDSINVKQDLANEVQPKEVSTERDHSAEANPEEEGHVIDSSKLDTERENDMHDMESSQVTVAQEPEPTTEKSLCDFDLNQEVCSDDVERPVDSISAPISVVSASKAAAVPGLPAAPLQFEGSLGWKGSAATSAFRPAPPRRNSDGDKTPSVGGTSSSSKDRQHYLDIDLNVAEGGDDKTVDVMSGKQITASSGLPSAESSLEVSPKRSERLNLDLNRISDEGDAPPLDLRAEGGLFYNRNGHRSPSPASSSSSMQPSLRNIDLNDRPYTQNDSSDQGPYHGRSRNLTVYGAPKADDPVISIMGTRVEIQRKDFIPHAASLPNGKALEPAVDANVTRTGNVLGLGPAVSYTHSPVFGYNGLATAPTMTFSSAMYGAGGSIPYMVDSRGAPVVPQIVGSASVVPPYSQPPFIMRMTGTPLSLNGAVPTRPNFDLNSGFALEGGNRDSIGLRQPFTPGQGRPLEEPLLRANSQPSSSSGVGGKRKEPDGGWESFNHRNQQFPWK